MSTGSGLAVKAIGRMLTISAVRRVEYVGKLYGLMVTMLGLLELPLLARGDFVPKSDQLIRFFEFVNH